VFDHPRKVFPILSDTLFQRLIFFLEQVRLVLFLFDKPFRSSEPSVKGSIDFFKLLITFNHKFKLNIGNLWRGFCLWDDMTVAVLGTLKDLRLSPGELMLDLGALNSDITSKLQKAILQLEVEGGHARFSGYSEELLCNSAQPGLTSTINVIGSGEIFRRAIGCAQGFFDIRRRCEV
jgi:hypothetical protein